LIMLSESRVRPESTQVCVFSDTISASLVIPVARTSKESNLFVDACRQQAACQWVRHPLNIP
jgi:hypothetical protein